MSVAEQVCDLISQHFGVSLENITVNSSFRNDIGADSLDMLKLGMVLEKTFRRGISDAQWDTIRTVGEAIACIDSVLSSASAENLWERWRTQKGRTLRDKVIDAITHGLDYASLIHGFQYVDEIKNGRDLRWIDLSDLRPQRRLSHGRGKQ